MSRPTAFITGIAGFAGSHLAEELLEAGFDVSGGLFDDEPTDNIDAVKAQLQLVPLDILKPESCTETIDRIRPEYIFHLAGFAGKAKTAGGERLTYRVNIEGTLNVLEAARQHTRLRKLLFISSSDVYGVTPPRGEAYTEEDILDPVSPYGISKAAGERTCRYFYSKYGLPAVIIRAFNHAGPRQGPGFVVADWAKQVAAIEAGEQEPGIFTGNVNVVKDFSDVRDIVRGYRLAAEKGKPGEVYQLCSGQSVAILKIFDGLAKLASVKIGRREDPSKLRKNDIPAMRGNNKKAAEQLGYTAGYSLDRTLADTMEYWRTLVDSGVLRK
jgi:GDP-4-dehydro-6-deoxy-D-mannose reductase